jgi:hypothetical protein
MHDRPAFRRLYQVNIGVPTSWLGAVVNDPMDHRILISRDIGLISQLVLGADCGNPTGFHLDATDRFGQRRLFPQKTNAWGAGTAITTCGQQPSNESPSLNSCQPSAEVAKRAIQVEGWKRKSPSRPRVIALLRGNPLKLGCSSVPSEPMTCGCQGCMLSAGR